MRWNRAALLALAGLSALGACGRNKPAPRASDAGSFSAISDLPVDVMPKLLESPITYPQDARARRIQGSLMVRALVGKDGRVKEVAPDTTQPAPPVLVKAALDAIREWKFEPARYKNEPVEIWICVPVQYRLQR